MLRTLFGVILIILLFFSQSVKSQNTYVLDSLNNVVKGNFPDTLKVNALNDLFWEYLYSDISEARPFAEKALSHSRSVHFKKGEASALNSLGVYYDESGNYKMALAYYQSAAAIFDSLKRYKSLGVVYSNIAIIYKMLGNFEKAMEYNFKALTMKEKYAGKDELSDSYNNIGSLYGLMGDNDKSLKYNFIALNLRKEAHNQRGVAYSLNNIADIYRIQKNFLSAISLYKEGLRDFTILKDSVGVATTLSNLGLTYGNLKNYTLAMNYLHQALQIVIRTGNMERMASIFQNFGELYYSVKDFKKSEDNYRKCYEISRKIGHLDMMMESAYYLSVIASQRNDYVKAFHFQKIFDNIKDSIFNIEKQKQLTGFEIRYKTAQKDNQIKFLNEQTRIQQLKIAQEKQWVIFVSILALLSIIIFLLIYGFRVFKNRQILLQAILRTENAERMRIARDMHDELGSGFSKILLFSEIARQNCGNSEILLGQLAKISSSTGELANHMRDLVWTMNPENSTLESLVARLREYCADFLDQFPLEYRLDFPDEIKPEILLQDVQRNIYFAMKEALNNAVKYADATHISVSFSISDTEMTVSVTDNGKGFHPETIRHGNGLKNMESRINALGGSFNINSSPGKGTVVSFSLNTRKLKHIPHL